MEEDHSIYLSGATNRRQLFEDRESAIRFQNKQNEDFADVTFERISILEEEQQYIASRQKTEIQNKKMKEEANDMSSTIKYQQEKKNQNGVDMSTSFQYIQQPETNQNTDSINQNLDNQSMNQVWRKSFFNLFYMIMYVFRLVKLQKQKLNPQRFNKLAVEIIADKAFDKCFILNEKLKQKKKNTKTVINRKICKCFNLIKFINKIYQYILTFINYMNDKFISLMIYIDQKVVPWDPYSSFIIFWERIQLLCLIYAFFYIPFRTNVEHIGMHEDFQYNNFFIFQNLQQFYSNSQYLYMVFVADILIRMNTQFFYEGEIIKTHQAILINYIKKRFFVDILAIFTLLFPKLYFFSQQEYIFLILKVNSLLELIDKFKENIFSIAKQELFNLFTLIVLDILAGHIVACQWVALGQWQKANNLDNWIEISGNSDANIMSLYIKSLYFSIVTMNTVGYGDFTPKTDLERIIDVAIILIGCVLFGYSIGKIGTILQSITKDRENLIQSMGGVNLYMRQNNIELDLQNKIRKYLEYIYLKRDREIQSNDFINQLSNNLQREISVKVQGEALKKIDIFVKNFSTEFIEELSLKVKQIYFCSDEIIQEENQYIKDPSIFILNQGRVEINFRSTNCRILKEKGEYFGQIEFFKMEYQSYYSLKSLGMSSLFQVNLTDFMNLLEKYPIEKENFYKISHAVKFYQSYQHISTACKICCSISHIEQDCNYIQYKPNHFKLVKQLHMIQQREKYSIRKLNKYNSIFNQKNVENALYSTDSEDQSEELSEPSQEINTANVKQSYQINNLEGKNEKKNDSIFSNSIDQQNSLNEENQTEVNNDCITLMQKKLNLQQKEQVQSPHRGQVIQVFVQQPSKEIDLKNKFSFRHNPLSQSDLQENPSLSRKSLASISSKKRRGSLSLAIDQFQSKTVLDQKQQTTSINNLDSSLKDNQGIINIKSQNRIKLNGASLPQIDQTNFRNISKSQDNIINSDQNLPLFELQQRPLSQIQIQEYSNSQFLDEKTHEESQNNFNYYDQNVKFDMTQSTIKPKQIEFKKEVQEQNQIEVKHGNRRISLPFLQLGAVQHKQKQSETNSHINQPAIQNLQNELLPENQTMQYQSSQSYLNLNINNQLQSHFDTLKNQLIEFMQQNAIPQHIAQQQQQQLIQLHPRKQQFYSQSYGSKIYYKQNTMNEQNNYPIQNLLDDIGKDYKIYFPQNNKSNVINLINIKKQKTGLNKSKFKHRNTQKIIKQKKSEFVNFK